MLSYLLIVVLNVGGDTLTYKEVVKDSKECLVTSEDLTSSILDTFKDSYVVSISCSKTFYKHKGI